MFTALSFIFLSPDVSLCMCVQDLLSFLGPLLRKSSEAHRNFSVIKRLRESENLQVWTSLAEMFHLKRNTKFQEKLSSNKSYTYKEFKYEMSSSVYH